MKKTLKLALYCVTTCIMLAVSLLPAFADYVGQPDDPYVPILPFDQMFVSRTVDGVTKEYSMSAPFGAASSITAQYPSTSGIAAADYVVSPGLQGTYNGIYSLWVYCSGSITVKFRSSIMYMPTRSAHDFLQQVYITTALHVPTSTSITIGVDIAGQTSYNAFGSRETSADLITYVCTPRSYFSSGRRIYATNDPKRIYAFGLNDIATSENPYFTNAWSMNTEYNLIDILGSSETETAGACRVSDFEYSVTFSFPDSSNSGVLCEFSIWVPVCSKSSYLQSVGLYRQNSFNSAGYLSFLASEDMGRGGRSSMEKDMGSFGRVFSALVPAAGSVLDTPFFGSWSIGTVGVVIIGIALLVFFIKMFMGG